MEWIIAIGQIGWVALIVLLIVGQYQLRKRSDKLMQINEKIEKRLGDAEKDIYDLLGVNMGELNKVYSANTKIHQKQWAKFLREQEMKRKDTFE